MAAALRSSARAGLAFCARAPSTSASAASGRRRATAHALRGGGKHPANHVFKRVRALPSTDPGLLVELGGTGGPATPAGGLGGASTSGASIDLTGGGGGRRGGGGGSGGGGGGGSRKRPIDLDDDGDDGCASADAAAGAAAAPVDLTDGGAPSGSVALARRATADRGGREYVDPLANYLHA